MTHNNRLSRFEAKRWAESLDDAERDRADEYPPTEPAMAATVPWLGCSDAEFIDELVENGRR
jgi:hypothetical protein